MKQKSIEDSFPAHLVCLRRGDVESFN